MHTYLNSYGQRAIAPNHPNTLRNRKPSAVLPEVLETMARFVKHTNYITADNLSYELNVNKNVINRILSVLAEREIVVAAPIASVEQVLHLSSLKCNAIYKIINSRTLRKYASED